MSRHALKGYRSVQAAGMIEGASPHQLTALLFKGALSFIETARLTNDGPSKHNAIDRALAIVGELQGSLRDIDTEPLAAQLYTLYAYIQQQLLEANRSSDIDPLNHAYNTLVPLQEAWAAIAPEADLVPSVSRPNAESVDMLRAASPR